MRSDISYGNGVYKSTDGGKTWAHLGLADTRQIGADPRRPEGPGRRLRRGARTRLRAERRARRLPVEGRGKDLGEGPLPGRGHGRDRPRLPARQRAHDPRRALADAPAAVERLPAIERARELPLALGGRRRHVEAGDGGPSFREARAHPDCVRAVRSEPRLRGRGREAGRPLRVGRRGAHVPARVVGPAHLGPRLVLRGRDRRPEGPGRRLRVQHGDLPVRGRREDVRAVEGRAGRRRLSPPLDRPFRFAPDDRRERPGHGRDGGRREDVELLVQPADRADVPRRDGRPVSVLDLRCAAGHRRRGRALAHGLPARSRRATGSRSPRAARTGTSSRTPPTQT